MGSSDEGRRLRRAGDMPRPNVFAARRLGRESPSRVSPREDKTRLPLQALLLVIELDVGLVDQGHVEVEREVAVRALDEGEAGVPAAQVPLEPHVVLAELARVQVVQGAPGRRPEGGGAEIHVERELPLAGEHAWLKRAGARGRDLGRARAATRVSHGEPESPPAPSGAARPVPAVCSPRAGLAGALTICVWVG